VSSSTPIDPRFIHVPGATEEDADRPRMLRARERTFKEASGVTTEGQSAGVGHKPT